MNPYEPPRSPASDYPGSALGERPPSTLGLVSTLLSITGLLGLAGVFGILIYEAAIDGELVKEDSPTAMVLGLVLVGCMGLQVLSLGLGLCGIFEKGRNPTRAIIGATLSVFTLAGIVGVLLLGSFYNSHSARLLQLPAEGAENR